MPSFSQNEFPELQESNLLHLDAAVGFDSPEKIRTAPRSKAVTASRVPEEAEHVQHLGTNHNHKGHEGTRRKTTHRWLLPLLGRKTEVWKQELGAKATKPTTKDRLHRSYFFIKC